MNLLTAIFTVVALSIHGVWHQPASSVGNNTGSLSLIIEQTKAHTLSLNSHPSPPAADLGLPSHSTVDRPTWAGVDVLSVTGVSDLSKVAPSVIQRIAVDMIAISTVVFPGQAEQFAVKSDGSTVPIGALGTANVATSEMPTPLTYPLNISRINDGNSPDRAVAAAQRDFSVGSIRTQDGLFGSTVAGALARAVHAVTAPDITECCGEFSAASLATPSGTLSGHRSYSFGVTPRAIPVAPGHLRASILPRMGA